MQSDIKTSRIKNTFSFASAQHFLNKKEFSFSYLCLYKMIYVFLSEYWLSIKKILYVYKIYLFLLFLCDNLKKSEFSIKFALKC